MSNRMKEAREFATLTRDFSKDDLAHDIQKGLINILEVKPA